MRFIARQSNHGSGFLSRRFLEAACGFSPADEKGVTDSQLRIEAFIRGGDSAYANAKADRRVAGVCVQDKVPWLEVNTHCSRLFIQGDEIVASLSLK